MFVFYLFTEENFRVLMLYLKILPFFFFKKKKRSLLQGDTAVLRGKASLWHVRASYMIFVCEGGQTPIGNGKHGLNDSSYKTWGTMVNQ